MNEINLADVVAEVTQEFLRYQKAVDANDVQTMNTLFWDSPHTVRFAYNGTLVGYASIAQYRQARANQTIERRLRNTVITTFGRGFAVTNTEVVRPDRDVVSRQSQAWIKTDDGWKIAAAHVSDQPV